MYIVGYLRQGKVRWSCIIVSWTLRRRTTNSFCKPLVSVYSGLPEARQGKVRWSCIIVSWTLRRRTTNSFCKPLVSVYSGLPEARQGKMELYHSFLDFKKKNHKLFLQAVGKCI